MSVSLRLHVERNLRVPTRHEPQASPQEEKDRRRKARQAICLELIRLRCCAAQYEPAKRIRRQLEMLEYVRKSDCLHLILQNRTKNEARRPLI